MLKKTDADDRADETLAPLPEEYSWLEGGQPYIVCGFYTPNYLPQITSLKESLEAHGISHFLKCYERQSTWEATIRLKPQFVDYCIKKFPDHDIAYLDADSVVRKPLTFFDDMNADVSLFFHPTKMKKKHVLRLAAGTVFVKNSEGGRRFAQLWKEQANDCDPLDTDEDLIYVVFKKLAGVSVRVMPREYYKIFDAPGHDPVIEHFQASRQVSNKASRNWRRIKRFSLIGGGVAAAGLIWWLSQNIQISWIG